MFIRYVAINDKLCAIEIYEYIKNAYEIRHNIDLYAIWAPRLNNFNLRDIRISPNGQIQRCYDGNPANELSDH